MNLRSIRKVSAAVVSSVILSTSAMAAEDGLPMLMQGNQELGLTGNAKISNDYDLNVNIKYGYFVRDGWEIGATVGTAINDDRTRIQAGLFTEYNFHRSGPWVPFIGASSEFGTATWDDRGLRGNVDDAKALVLGVEFGVKYFIRPGIALQASAGFDYGIGDSIFGAAGDARRGAADVQLGMRFFF